MRIVELLITVVLPVAIDFRDNIMSFSKLLISRTGFYIIIIIILARDNVFIYIYRYEYIKKNPQSNPV